MSAEAPLIADRAPAAWLGVALDPPSAYGGPLAPARLKESAGDFLVRERLSFSADGGAAHQLLEVRKNGRDTLEVARALSRHAGCAPREVGFAGLKDRIAVATQWFSVPAKAAALDWRGWQTTGIEVLSASPHSRKLRRGALAGNAFRIVLREFAAEPNALTARLALIKERGVPNYFGAQRFGRGGANLEAIAAWCADGRLPEAREPRAFVLSAARALIFNAVLATRVADGSWEQLLPGEFVNLAGRNSYFIAATIDATLEARLACHDIHPTGPLSGAGRVPAAAAGELEARVLADYRELSARLAEAGLEAARRPLRVRPQDLAATPEGADWVLEFGLPAGAFATAVLRELASTETRVVEVDDA